MITVVKWWLVTTLMTGCAAYTVVSTATGIVTGKSVPELAMGAATHTECSWQRWARDRDHWCEQPRDEGTHYVRVWD